MNYECDVCGKKFKSAQQLGGHKSSHFRTETSYASRRGKHRTPEQKAKYRKGFQSRTPEQEKRRLEGYYAFRAQEQAASPYIVSGVKLNVSKAFIEKYRGEHRLCQICGKSERKAARNGVYKGNKIQKLCVDHIHGTNVFRGLLCNDCNKKLGWLENNREAIQVYLESSPNG